MAWQNDFPTYKPVTYTAPCVLARPVWADPPLDSELVGEIHWNALDGKVDRRSHMGIYACDKISHLPLNPVGRTGISGRGLLGRYGPNHAADPIVARYIFIIS